MFSLEMSPPALQNWGMKSRGILGQMGLDSTEVLGAHTRSPSGAGGVGRRAQAAGQGSAGDGHCTQDSGLGCCLAFIHLLPPSHGSCSLETPIPLSRTPKPRRAQEHRAVPSWAAASHWGHKILAGSLAREGKGTQRIIDAEGFITVREEAQGCVEKGQTQGHSPANSRRLNTNIPGQGRALLDVPAKSSPQGQGRGHQEHLASPAPAQVEQS